MALNEFNNQFLDDFMNKISIENKIAYLAGDFNMNLLNVSSDNDINEFYQIMTSHLFISHITLPARIIPPFRFLII